LSALISVLGCLKTLALDSFVFDGNNGKFRLSIQARIRL
jgi:hypothetical protein